MKAFSLVDRTEFQKVLEEIEFSQTDIVDETKVIEMGKILSAPYILTGSVLKSFGMYRIVAKIIRTETTGIVSSASMTVNSSQFDNFAKDLLSEKNRITSSLFRSTILPGWGQLYSDQNIRGVISMTAGLGMLGGSIYCSISSYNAHVERDTHYDFQFSQAYSDSLKKNDGYEVNDTLLAPVQLSYAYYIIQGKVTINGIPQTGAGVCVADYTEGMMTGSGSDFILRKVPKNDSVTLICAYGDIAVKTQRVGAIIANDTTDVSTVIDSFIWNVGGTVYTTPTPLCQVSVTGLAPNTLAAVITNCFLSGNSAKQDGGGAYFDKDCKPLISNCTFLNNFVSSQGGAIYCDDADALINNCTFVSNTSGGGGALYIRHYNIRVINCTFSYNTSNIFGGGIYLYSSDRGNVILNCILWDNSGASEENEIYNSNQAPIIIRNTVIKGGFTDTIAILSNIITNDPSLGSLADNGGPVQTMSLNAGSSALDTGLYVYQDDVNIFYNTDGGTSYLDIYGNPYTPVGTVTQLTTTDARGCQDHRAAGLILGRLRRSEKMKRLKTKRNLSVRTVLICEGLISERVIAEQYFNKVITFSEMLNIV